MIDSMVFETFVNRRASTFRIATGSSDVEENIIVKLVSGDEFGVGSGNPSTVTQETRGSMEEFLAKVPKKIVGTDENDVDKLHQRLEAIAPGNTAAKAAVDIALFDLLSKRERKPLYAFLGGSKNKIMTDMTIGIESKETAVQRADKHVKSGFKALKVKVGLDLNEDIKRVSAIREAVGNSIQLRVDANQGYTADQAIQFCEAMLSLDVVVVEQPVKADDYAALKKVTQASEVPIMADECVKSVLDVRKVAREGIADMINIKLMKSAGVNDAVMMDRLAAAADMGTMVGCMGEIQLSIAAGLHFALSSDNVMLADLDSHFNIVDDPTSGLAFEDGCLWAPNAPGLGIRTPLDGR
ncbi:MAG: dipeptide epimerase [Thermoplasmata archaeon]|jgi:L-alanine-DL-glutamate epimerase-like enolase superfamily enzyme|nr:dipeptide epimerase [Thermoplasmata archaeon]